MHNFDFPEKHPIAWVCLCVGVVSLPQWLSGTWALFSDEPLAKVVARNLDMMEIPFSPYWITVPLGLLMFAFAFYWKATGSRKKSTDITPPLSVEYEEHAGSFYQESPIHRPGFGKGVLQIARIKVIGKRIEPVQDVQVKVQEIIPEQEQIYGLPFHAQRMNDNIQPYQRATTFSKDQEEYFDVVGYERLIVSTGRLHFRRIDGVDGAFNDEPCHMLIRITALGIDKIDRWFRVWVDENNNLRMIQATAPQLQQGIGATLKIKYTDEAANRRFMRFEGNGGPCTWYLEIVNESPDTDAQDVEIKVESCDQIPDLLNPHIRTAAFMPVGIVLPFERGGQTRTIRRQDS